jgi:hypothetical protein
MAQLLPRPVLMRCPFHIPRQVSDSESEYEVLHKPNLMQCPFQLYVSEFETDLQTAYDHLNEEEYEEYIADRRMCL